MNTPDRDFTLLIAREVIEFKPQGGGPVDAGTTLDFDDRGKYVVALVDHRLTDDGAIRHFVVAIPLHMALTRVVEDGEEGGIR
jgi:hypothetical protein